MSRALGGASGGAAAGDHGTAAARLTEYLAGRDPQPLFLCGDALETLRLFPTASVDCCLTSPPYFCLLYTSPSPRD